MARIMRQKEFEEIEKIISWLQEDSERYFKLCDARLSAIEERLGIKAGFNPNQPRVPAGSSDGGQWTDSGGNNNVLPKKPRGYTVEDLNTPGIDAIEEIHPEKVLSIFPVVRAASAISNAARVWSNRTSVINKDTKKIMNSIENYLGGKPDRVIRNKSGDLVVMRGDKKIRFDQ